MLSRTLPRALPRLSSPLSSTAAARSSTTSLTHRTLSTTQTPRAAASHDDHHGGHDSHYDAPGGWLWGVRPGEKRQREGWETGMFVYCASVVIAVVAYTMKEDTSIQTWALEEARRRLEKEGILEDPEK